MFLMQKPRTGFRTRSFQTFQSPPLVPFRICLLLQTPRTALQSAIEETFFGPREAVKMIRP